MTKEEAWNRIDAIITKNEVDDEYVTITNGKDYDALRYARKALEQEQRWIPVSERLPEKYSYTLWCASSGCVRSDYFNGEFWEDAKRYCYEVIAWMSLPKPYKAESEEKE